MKKKALIGITAIGAALCLRQVLQRGGHKPCKHCGQTPCRCKDRKEESTAKPEESTAKPEVAV